MINLDKGEPIAVNTGLLIEKFLSENHIPKAELMRRLGMSHSGLYRIINSPSIHTDNLIRISKALNHDFLKDISEKVFSKGE